MPIIAKRFKHNVDGENCLLYSLQTSYPYHPERVIGDTFAEAYEKLRQEASEGSLTIREYNKGHAAIVRLWHTASHDVRHYVLTGD